MADEQIKEERSAVLESEGNASFGDSKKPGYKKTKLGWIPVEWEVSSIGQCSELLSGGTPRKNEKKYWDGEIPWYSAKDLKSFLLRDSQDHVTDKGVKNGTKLVPKGTILILVRGMMLNRGLPLGIITSKASFNQDVKALIPKQQV